MEGKSQKGLVVISDLVCRVVGHSINRRRVRFDGLYFATTCKRCANPILRETQGWTLAKNVCRDERQAS